MKMMAIALMILALILIIVPSFFTCASQGKAIQLPSGKNIPMKCLWTARAEIGLGVLLLATGALFFFSAELETKRFLSILALILGIFVVLFPANLIGVCRNPEMVCRVVMNPILLLTGILTAVLGIAAAAWNFTRKSKTA
jgi:hypothetical protein